MQILSNRCAIQRVAGLAYHTETLLSAPLSTNAATFTHPLPAELRLLLACGRWPGGAPEDVHVRGLLEEPGAPALDWDRLLALAGHHRVAPMVHRALRRATAASPGVVPARVWAELKAASTHNAFATLQWLAETQRLCQLLRNDAVEARVLKGVPLSRQIFGDPALRQVGDIDLLILPGKEEAADLVLQAAGYYRNDPAAPLTPRRRLSWRRHGKDYTYRSDRYSFEIDLHWRLFRNPHMPGNGLSDPPEVAREQMLLGETPVQVLPPDRCFLFLCVHGALDGWFRLKSLVDVAAWWRTFTQEQRLHLTSLARQYGVLPELASGLCLSMDFELLQSDDVSPALLLQAQGREALWIQRHAQTEYVRQAWQPTQDGVGTLGLKRYEFGLRRNLPYRMEILRRVLLRPRVWARFDLPDPLFPLYMLLSPLEWLIFHHTIAPAAVARRQRSRWRRLFALPRRRLILAAEAFVTLLTSRLALHLLPARWIFQWLERPLQKRLEQEGVAEEIRWSVLSVARYGPLTFVCFPQALAAHAMLRRRGVPSTLHYGVRRAADRRMRAHTWLEVKGSMLLGGESAPLFARTHSSGPGEAD